LTAPLGPTEQQQLQAFWSSDLMDTPPHPGLDRIAGLARTVSGAPIAMVSLVDENRQLLKACAGLATGETADSHGFCRQTINARDLLVVPDAAADARFANIARVAEKLAIRFYAGAPIVLSNGAAVGTVCVIDRLPRAGLKDGAGEALMSLAEMARDQIEATDLLRTREVTIAELQHRLSNAFTQMMALIHLTRNARSTKEEYIAELRRRIVQLDEVNRRLASGGWKRGAARTIIDAALGQISSDNIYRLEIVGEDVEVEGPLAMALSMATFELATNSLKHGVLAGGDGSPQIKLAKKDGHFSFEWREAVRAAETRASGPGSGFGSILLQRLLPAEVKGKADYKVNRAGVSYRLTAPLSAQS
jgi:two-component sensor histidine kinase